MPIHLLLAIAEFFLINWLGKHSISSGYYWITFVQDTEQSPLFNVAFRILAPTIYLIVTAAGWYAVGWDSVVTDYWHVTLFYFLVRWAYILVAGRRRIVRWGHQLTIAVVATGLSLWVSQQLLSDKAIVLPSGRALTDQLWIVVIAFVYLAFRNVAWPTLGKTDEERRADYMRTEYESLRAKFGATVSGAASSRATEAVAYSVMMYESFNRPPIYQWLERHVLYPFGHAHTLGPMQVTTTIALPDEELVRLGVERVNEYFERAIKLVRQESPERFAPTPRLRPTEPPSDTPRPQESQLTRFEDLHRVYQSAVVMKAASFYNVRSDYPDQVASIFKFLRDKYYPEVRGPGSDEGLG